MASSPSDDVYERFARDFVGRRAAATGPSFDRIAVASDFSADSLHALVLAEELARRLAAEIVVVHVQEALAAAPGAETAGGPGAAAAALDRLVAAVRDGGCRARGVLRAGAAAAEIVEAARAERAALIVIGTHGRTGLAHALMGSVAEQVVRTAPCPVLTVRPPR